MALVNGWFLGGFDGGISKARLSVNNSQFELHHSIFGFISYFINTPFYRNTNYYGFELWGVASM
jgi:hypothetical protein